MQCHSCSMLTESTITYSMTSRSVHFLFYTLNSIMSGRREVHGKTDGVWFQHFGGTRNFFTVRSPCRYRLSWRHYRPFREFLRILMYHTEAARLIRAG